MDMGRQMGRQVVACSEPYKNLDHSLPREAKSIVTKYLFAISFVSLPQAQSPEENSLGRNETGLEP